MTAPVLIAEVSSNHGGNLDLAKEFIKRFADAGATYVKFQTTRVAHLNPADPQYAWFQQAELSDDAHAELYAVCQDEGVQFLTTIYNQAEIPLIKRLGLPMVKLGSGEACDNDLVRAIEAAGIVPLRSYHAVGWVLPLPPRNQKWLATVCRYPASRPACLEAIAHLGTLGVVGYSDHSVGLEMPMWALERGAQIVEKHVRLPNQAREGKCYEATAEEFRVLRTYADESPERFKGRWAYA